MTKEQEAIEILEGMVKSYIQADECGLSNNDFKHEIKAMQTALNMIKENSAEMQQKNTELAEKNAEIEKLKADNKKAWILNANMSKRHLTDIFKIKKKDKIIDLMAERIEWLCKSNEILLDKEHEENFTQEDIKQYFERKSEE